MPTKCTLFIATALLFVFSSCHKHNNSSKGPLDGTWTFSSYSASTLINTSTVNNDSAKIVSNVTSTNNTGVIVFGGDSMAVKGLGYIIDTSATLYGYYYGINVGTTTIPIADTVTSTSYTVNYQLVGTDSIYFPLGALFVVNVGLNTGESVVIQGAHYAVSGNTLTFTSSIVQADTINVSNTNYPAVTQIKSTIVMNKQ